MHIFKSNSKNTIFHHRAGMLVCILKICGFEKNLAWFNTVIKPCFCPSPSPSPSPDRGASEGAGRAAEGGKVRRMLGYGCDAGCLESGTFFFC